MLRPLDTGMAAIGAAYVLMPDHYASPEATTLLLAIGLQESRFEHRWQIVNSHDPSHMGPARGFWQFEQGGGVAGVLAHKSSSFHAAQLCRIFNITPVASYVHPVLHRSDLDVLAAGLARLLLWTDPRPLPELGNAEAAWEYYIRNWRPGKPHPTTWQDFYQRALDYVQTY